MNAEQAMVHEFHRAFDIAVASRPQVPDAGTRALRLSLIQEELDELREGFAREDLVEVADALADLLYVTYGAAVSCGVDLAPIFAEVHRSNMTKVGGTRRADGKWIKPVTYSPARIEPLIVSQQTGDARP